MEDAILRLDGPLTKDQETNLVKVLSELGHKEVVIEIKGERRVIRLVQTDAEGRELLEE